MYILYINVNAYEINSIKYRNTRHNDVMVVAMLPVTQSPFAYRATP